MKNQSDQLEGLMALLLFGVFAVCLLVVLLTGANSYQNLTRRDQASSDRRTCAQYLATRVRQCDREGCVSVGKFGDDGSLIFSQIIEGEEYVTVVYTYGGYLMELFHSAEITLSPEDGERLMPAGGMTTAIEDGMLRVGITPEGGERAEVLLSLRSGEGGLG